MQGLEVPSSTYGLNASADSPYCGVFWQQVSAGVHTVKMQWRVLSSNEYGESVYAAGPCLIVYALPS
jgi:hypothetical protein